MPRWRWGVQEGGDSSKVGEYGPCGAMGRRWRAWQARRVGRGEQRSGPRRRRQPWWVKVRNPRRGEWRERGGGDVPLARRTGLFAGEGTPTLRRRRRRRRLRWRAASSHSFSVRHLFFPFIPRAPTRGFETTYIRGNSGDCRGFPSSKPRLPNDYSGIREVSEPREDNPLKTSPNLSYQTRPNGRSQQLLVLLCHVRP